MSIVFASIVVDGGFKPWSDQTQDYKKILPVNYKFLIFFFFLLKQGFIFYYKNPWLKAVMQVKMIDLLQKKDGRKVWDFKWIFLFF
jgi:hypothetical protein